MDKCLECGHLVSMHIGPIDMGGGMMDALGCTFVIDKEREILCDCEETSQGSKIEGVAVE